MAFRFNQLILLLFLFFTVGINKSFATEDDEPKFKLSYWKQEHSFDKTGFVFATIEGTGARLQYNVTDYLYLSTETLSLDYNFLNDFDYDQFVGIAFRTEVDIRQKLYGVGFRYSFNDHFRVHIEFNDLESEANFYHRKTFYGERNEIGLSYSPLEDIELLLAYSKQSIDHQSSDTFITEISYQVISGLGVFYHYRNSEQGDSSTRIGVTYQF